MLTLLDAYPLHLPSLIPPVDHNDMHLICLKGHCNHSVGISDQFHMLSLYGAIPTWRPSDLQA